MELGDLQLAKQLFPKDWYAVPPSSTPAHTKAHHQPSQLIMRLIRSGSEAAILTKSATSTILGVFMPGVSRQIWSGSEASQPRRQLTDVSLFAELLGAKRLAAAEIAPEARTSACGAIRATLPEVRDSRRSECERIVSGCQSP